MKRKNMKKSNNITKSDLVKMLLSSDEFDEYNEKELFTVLIEQPLSIDIDKQEDSNLSFGERMADKISSIVGSWKFIIIFTCFLVGWMILNTFILRNGNEIDKYPFILLNLLLSCIAAIQAPIIMMSQNRQAKKDALRNKNDYKIDLKSELILEELHDKIILILKQQKDILKKLEKK